MQNSFGFVRIEDDGGGGLSKSISFVEKRKEKKKKIGTFQYKRNVVCVYSI